jgi:hypothetical protein
LYDDANPALKRLYDEEKKRIAKLKNKNNYSDEKGQEELMDAIFEVIIGERAKKVVHWEEAQAEYEGTL